MCNIICFYLDTYIKALNICLLKKSIFFFLLSPNKRSPFWFPFYFLFIWLLPMGRGGGMGRGGSKRWGTQIVVAYFILVSIVVYYYSVLQSFPVHFCISNMHFVRNRIHCKWFIVDDNKKKKLYYFTIN